MRILKDFYTAKYLNFYSKLSVKNILYVTQDSEK